MLILLISVSDFENDRCYPTNRSFECLCLPINLNNIDALEKFDCMCRLFNFACNVQKHTNAQIRNFSKRLRYRTDQFFISINMFKKYIISNTKYIISLNL